MATYLETRRIDGTTETVYDDNGDGTGSVTTYDADGITDLAVETLTGLPIPDPVPSDPYEVYAAAIEAAQTLEEVRAAGATLRAALEAS